MDGLIRHTQLLAHSQGGQGVVDAERARHVDPDVHHVLAADVEGDPQEIMGPQQLAVSGPVVGLLPHAVGYQPAGVAFQQGLGVGVVDVDDAGVAALEQLALPAAVFLKAGVFAGADVVGGQVGKDAHVVVDAGHPVHHQALAGNLHHHRVTAGLHKGVEDLLQLIALGSGVGSVLMVAHVVDAVGADHSHLAARSLQNAADHVGGGGLALGASDADHGHLPGGVAEQVGAHQGHGIAAALHLQDGDPGQAGQVDVVLDHNGCGALGGAVGGIVMAVPLGAHNADKQGPGSGFPAVVDNVGDLGVHAALYQGTGNSFGQSR